MKAGQIKFSGTNNFFFVLGKSLLCFPKLLIFCVKNKQSSTSRLPGV